MKVFELMRAAAICMLSLLVCAANANGPERFTSWEFYAGKTSRGTGLCSLSVASRGSPARNLSIKSLANRDGLNITIFSEDWNYSSGANVAFSLDFADQQPLALRGYGDGRVVDVELPKDATAVFLSLLGERSIVQFQIGEQRQRLSVPLAGINPKLKSFVDCAMKQGEPRPEEVRKSQAGFDDMCKSIRFTGLGATRFPYELEDAKMAIDLEDHLARNPILCKPNGSCRGIGYFKNARASVLNGDRKYLHVMAPVDLSTGRRDIYLAIFRTDARCTRE